MTDWQIQNGEIKGWNFSCPESFSLGLCQFLQLCEKFSSHEKRVVKIVLILMLYYETHEDLVKNLQSYCPIPALYSFERNMQPKL